MRAFLLALLAIIIVVPILRTLLGAIGRAFTNLAVGSAPQPKSRDKVPSGGELKKDPVCGTFVPVVSSVKKMVKGEPVYFCSAECRDKYAG